MKTIILGLFLTCFSAFGALTEVDRAEFVGKSILKDSGFETGKAAWSTAGSTISIVYSGTNLLEGKASATWDASATTMTLRSTAVTIPKGLYGKNGEAYCSVQTPSGTATHKLEVLASGNTLTSTSVLSSTLPVKTSTNFIFPSTGTIQLGLLSQANEPLIAIDKCYLGEATNIASVAQATFYGGVSYPTVASCLWFVANSAFANLPSDNDCTGRTLSGNATGPADSSGNRTPSVTFATLPAGKYLIIATGKFNGDNSSGSLQHQYYRLSDGTNNSSAMDMALPTGDTVRPGFQTLTWSPTYMASQSNISFQVQAAASTNGEAFIDNQATGDKFEIMVYRFPLASEQVFNPASQTIYASVDATNTSAGFNSASATYVDVSTGVFGAKTYYGQAVSPSTTADFALRIGTFPVGDYYFSVNANVTSTSASTACVVRLYDGTNTIIETTAPLAGSAIAYDQYGGFNGVYKKTSATGDTTIKAQIKSNGGGACYLGAANGNVSITMIPLSTPITMPILVGGVMSSSTGADKLERISFGGASEISACTSSPCTIYRQSGSWVTSVTRNSTGDYTLNIATGTFSARPTCTWSIGNTSNYAASIRSTGTAASATTLRIIAAIFSNTAEDFAVDLICMGPK